MELLRALYLEIANEQQVPLFKTHPAGEYRHSKAKRGI